MTRPDGQDHLTAEDLARALLHVLAAPRDAGRITCLCVRPAPNQRQFPQTLRLTRAEGVPGDRWLTQPWLRRADGTPDPRIQVAVMPARVLDLVWHDPDLTHPGGTLAADLDLSAANLPAGTLLRAGTAVLRVSDVPNDGCAKWKVRFGAAAMQWIIDPAHAGLRLRGILCTVETDGELAVGNMLTVLR
jgi:hypothetical protein